VQVATLRKSDVTPSAVDGNSEQFGIVFLEFRQDLVKERQFVSANRTPISRIEGENDWLSLEIRQGDRLVWRGLERNAGPLDPGGSGWGFLARPFWDSLDGASGLLVCVGMTHLPFVHLLMFGMRPQPGFKLWLQLLLESS